MATRPIFISEPSGPFLVRTRSIEFNWHAGMSRSRRQMSMRSLHEAVRSVYPDSHILEVSRMSDERLGEQLSAFNLTLEYEEPKRNVPVECVFQASKVFELGGPFRDLLMASPIDAKRDPRLRESGRLKRFHYLGEDWPNEPLTAFYDWIYIKALHSRPELASEVCRYNIFTDIAFNPQKSINSQAHAVALYVSLFHRRQLDSALTSREAFLNLERGASLRDHGQGIQGSLF